MESKDFGIPIGIIDRYPELEIDWEFDEKYKGYFYENEKGDEGDSGDKKKMYHEEHDEEEFDLLKQFFAVADKIKIDLISCKESTKVLGSLYYDSIHEVQVLKSPKSAKKKLKKKRVELSSMFETMKQRINKVHKHVRELENELTEGGRKKKTNWKTAEYRIKENVLKTLLKDFANAIHSRQDEEHKYRTGRRDDVKRDLTIVSDDAKPPDENLVDEFLEKGDMSVFKKAIKNHSIGRTIAIQMRIARETQDELLELDMGMNEILEMFREMYALVEKQDDLIDSIEMNVERASVSIEKGLQEMKKARKASKKMRGGGIIQGLFKSMF